jgi:hypothetical protein
MADKEKGAGKSAEPPKPRLRAPPMTKAELRAQADLAMAAATKPIVKLPTKLVRQCGRCGEFSSVMVEPGDAPPEFKCKSCDGTRGPSATRPSAKAGKSDKGQKSAVKEENED